MAALKNFEMFKKNVGTQLSNFGLSTTDIFLRSAVRFFFFFSGKLFHKITLTTLAKGVYLFGEPNTRYFDRAPRGLLPFSESYSRKKLF